MSAKFRDLLKSPQPEIKITFNNPQKTYTTLDRIDGVASITAPEDTLIADIKIELVGATRTYGERLTMVQMIHGRSQSFHVFLRLTQPIERQDYPEDSILRAGVTYIFPFAFATPEHLLPRSCQHKVNGAAQHLQLPPTLFDRNTRMQNNSDNAEADVASIRYAVVARVDETRTKSNEAFKATIAAKARKVRVLPSLPARPPLDIGIDDDIYVMRKEQSIRRGLLRSRLGSLVMEAAQPEALQIRSLDNPEARINSAATIVLRYDPVDSTSSPPKLGELKGRLAMTTDFAHSMSHNLPIQKSKMENQQGVRTEQIDLFSRNMSSVKWTEHKSSQVPTANRLEPEESPSMSWKGGIPASSNGFKGETFYTASLVMPIQLPADKAFVPSFESCLIARVYSLRFNLDISGGGIGGSSVELNIPVQISTEGLQDPNLLRRDSFSSSGGTSDYDIDGEDDPDFFASSAEIERANVPSDGSVIQGRVEYHPARYEEGFEGSADAPPEYSSAMAGRSSNN